MISIPVQSVLDQCLNLDELTGSSLKICTKPIKAKSKPTMKIQQITHVYTLAHFENAYICIGSALKENSGA